MTKTVINSENSLKNAVNILKDNFSRFKYVEMRISSGKSRSISQNSISHTWYEQLSREMPDDDALGWKCYCKLHHGVPILRAEEDGFRESYDMTVKRMSYEEKLIVMRILPVTSIMSTEQFSKYLQAVKDDFEKKRVFLLFPDCAENEFLVNGCFS